MSSNYSAILERLLNGEHLAEAEAADLMRDLATGDIEPALAGARLAALRAKGETAEEIRGLANAMRHLARDPGGPPGPPMVETGGTGDVARAKLPLPERRVGEGEATVEEHGGRGLRMQLVCCDEWLGQERFHLVGTLRPVYPMRLAGGMSSCLACTSNKAD